MAPKSTYSRRSRKRQTQLIFNPLDVDLGSRAVARADGLSPAMVRYELPGVRRSERTALKNVREVREGGNGDGVTVADSVETEDERDELVRGDTEDLLCRTTGKSRGRKRQVGSDSTGSSRKKLRGDSVLQVLVTPGEPLNVMNRNANNTETRPSRSGSKVNTNSGTRRSSRVANIKDLIMAKHTGSSRKAYRRISPDSSEGSSPEDVMQTPLQRMTTKRKSPQPATDFDDDDLSSYAAVSTGDGSFESDLRYRSTRSTQRKSPASKRKLNPTPSEGQMSTKRTPAQVRRDKSITLSDESSSSEDMAFHSSVIKKGASQRQSQPKSQNQSIISLLESESEEEEQPIMAKSERRLQKTVVDESEEDSQPVLPPISNRKMPREPSVDSDSMEVEDESDDIVTTSARRRRSIVSSHKANIEQQSFTSPLKRRTQAIHDSDFDEIVSSPLKRRKTQQALLTEADKPTTDDDDVRSSASRLSSGTPSRTPRQKTKTWRHRTAKEKQMELLRRRRKGEKIDQVTDSETPDEESEDEREELKVLDKFPDESDGGQEVEQQSSSAERTRVAADDDSSDEDDFVVEDNNQSLGIQLSQIPLHFTHAATKRGKDHFKDMVEWLVHNKINPSFNRDDPVYRQAYLKVDDVSRGYARSQLVSSAWTADFTRAIWARPFFAAQVLGPAERVNADGDVKCDACNHRSHVPIFVVVLGGRAYHVDTLLEVGREEEDSEDEDELDGEEEMSDEGDVNSNGQLLPDKNKKWFVGRNCKQKASLAHALIHWKFRLNSLILDQLEEDGQLTPQAINKRQKMTPRQRTDEANRIVDLWERSKQVSEWYSDFKRGVDEAKTEGEKGAWGR